MGWMFANSLELDQSPLHCLVQASDAISHRSPARGRKAAQATRTSKVRIMYWYSRIGGVFDPEQLVASRPGGYK